MFTDTAVIPEMTTPAAEAVEVVDAAGRPLGVVEVREAHRQMLRHPAVMVLVFDPRGKLCLHRRPERAQAFPGRWDLALRRHPAVGQALEDAAQQELEDNLPSCRNVLSRHARLEASEHTGFELITLFRVSLPRNAGRVFDPVAHLFVDQDELTALSAQYRDLFTPMVIHALEQGVLFRQAS